ncbi:kinase-like protein [Cadophora sp. DSE1049]|nr:kinase-like protein [Cadophora sp. DSE1049]
MSVQALSAGEIARSSLSEALQEEFHYWPPPPATNTYFIPNNRVEDLVKIERVRPALDGLHPSLPSEKLDALADVICSEAKKLFAIFLMSEKLQTLLELLDERITDLDLPFSRILLDKSKPSSSLYKLGRRSHDKTKWGKVDIQNLCSLQWSLLAPVFRSTVGKINHYDLQYNIILPYIEDEEGQREKIKVGGFSQVWGVKIHRAHQKLLPCPSDKDPIIAIKRLSNPDRTLFERESEMLSDLTSSRHPNLINLLATYTHRSKDHLMFPYADCNLREYWNAKPLPPWNQVTAIWAIKQMRGLMDATCIIHNFQPTHPLEPATPKKYGRHGDLKPENILCVKNLKDGSMNLQITDLGLGKFHGQNSRSKSRPTNGSPTYASPEIVLDIPVSRMYDIWSMGCVFLEFVTWLLQGPEGLNRFHEVRFGDAGDGVKDDTYYTIKETGDGKRAVVRPSVSSWVADLKRSTRYSGMIQRVLYLVHERMLKGGASDRLCAHCLNAEFELVLNKAMTDTRYLLQRSG